MQLTTMKAVNDLGNLEQGIQAYVYLKGTTTQAQIYSDNGVTLLTQPITSDVEGDWDFYAANGYYDFTTVATTNVTAKTTSFTVYDFNNPAQDTSPANAIIFGTTTNNNAPVGAVGEYIQTVTPGTTATVTISIAAPGVITWTAHGLVVGSRVTFTTTGALPTGLTAGTPYFVVSVIDANNFTVSATAFGTAITTSGTQSGVQTGTASVNLTTGTAANIAAVQLTAGDWDILGYGIYHSASGTTVPADVKQGISAVSGTIGSIGTYTYDYVGIALSATDDPTYPTGIVRLSLSATTVVYLVIMSDFSVSTLTGYGFIRARRVR